MNDNASKQLKIIDLPDEVLEKIFSYMTFDEIAHKREVCKIFNSVSGQLLNRGFYNVERKHAMILKKFKVQLPRRESERKAHPLSRHCNILTAVGARINMLSLTYMKYIEANLCCFIPGKVIDEILKILNLIEVTDTPPRALLVLQELCDVSVMAIEHFDEKIAPNLKISLRNTIPSFTISGPSNFSQNISRIVLRDAFQKDLSKVKQRTVLQKQQIITLNRLVLRLTTKLQRQRVVIISQSAKLRQQSRKLREQNKTISDIKHRLDEWDQKFSDVMSKLNPRDELLNRTMPIINQQPTSSQLPFKSTISRSSPPRIFKSNIKPRSAQILPKNVKFDLSAETERKRKLPTSSLLSIPNKMSRVQLICNQEDEQIDDDKGYINCQSENMFPKLPMFISSSLETLLKSPITSIKSRKRKL